MGDAEIAEPIPPDTIDYDPNTEERKPKLMGRDPVCGTDVDPGGASAKSVYRGKEYFFCSVDCKTEFDEQPSRYVG